jgi:hypothetical protein
MFPRERIYRAWSHSARSLVWREAGSFVRIWGAFGAHIHQSLRTIFPLRFTRGKDATTGNTAVFLCYDIIKGHRAGGSCAHLLWRRLAS